LPPNPTPASLSVVCTSPIRIAYPGDGLRVLIHRFLCLDSTEENRVYL
jgi:hypothetical protein